MFDSEKPCTFLRCCIILLQVVLQVLHMYFIKKEKVRKYKSLLVHESDFDELGSKLSLI